MPAHAISFAGAPGTTLSVAVPDFPSDVAVTVTLPGIFALASPVDASIDITAGSELDHVTGRVIVAPSMSLSVAESCRVVTTGTGVRSPPIVTLSTRGGFMIANTPARVTEAVTVLSEVFAALPATTVHAPPTSS